MNTKDSLVFGHGPGFIRLLCLILITGTHFQEHIATCHAASPQPPVLESVPKSQVVNHGSTATLSVLASGNQLSYQWRFNGLPIHGETNNQLRITGAQDSATGRYSVMVSNTDGAISTRPVVLRVRPQAAGMSPIPAAGLLREWLFEGGYNESTNRLASTIVGKPGLVDGVSPGSRAARFNAGSDGLQLGGPSDVLGGSSYTASFWIRPEGTGSLFVYSLRLLAGGADRLHYFVLGGDDFLGGPPSSTNGHRIHIVTIGARDVFSSDNRAYVPNLKGKWTHVAVSYQANAPGQAPSWTVYINGSPIPLATSSEFTTASNLGPNAIAPIGPNQNFLLDDFRLYNRVITPEEVSQLSNPPPSADISAPSIVNQPVGGNVEAGGAFNLTVEAEGGDLFYEWYHGDEILAEASGPELSIENFSSAKAGAYRVRISNSIGKLESLPALLQPGSPTNTFAAWAVASGLAGNKALPEADPDGDGFINFAEYLYGTSATSPNQKPSFQMGTVVVKGVEYSSASFMRRSRPGSGRLTYATAMTPTFDDAEPAEVYAVKSLPDGLELVVVRATQPLHNQQPQFFRFAVQK